MIFIFIANCFRKKTQKAALNVTYGLWKKKKVITFKVLQIRDIYK